MLIVPLILDRSKERNQTKRDQRVRFSYESAHQTSDVTVEVAPTFFFLFMYSVAQARKLTKKYLAAIYMRFEQRQLAIGLPFLRPNLYILRDI